MPEMTPAEGVAAGFEVIELLALVRSSYAYHVWKQSPNMSATYAVDKLRSMRNGLPSRVDEATIRGRYCLPIWLTFVPQSQLRTVAYSTVMRERALDLWPIALAVAHRDYPWLPPSLRDMAEDEANGTLEVTVSFPIEGLDKLR